MSQDLRELKVSWFAPPAIATIGECEGLLGSAGLRLHSKRTESSDEQFGALLERKVDVAVTAMDNVLGWNRRGEGHDFRVIAQIETQAPISLVSRPEIRSVAKLAGRELLVDSRENGFVVALFAALHDAGVDFRGNPVTEAGGVTERFEALVAGCGAATLLGPPFTEMAVARGMHLLGRVGAWYPAFPGQGLVVRQGDVANIEEPLNRWLGVLEQARFGARQDPQGACGRLMSTGIPKPIAARLTENIPETLIPAAAGVALLYEQRARLGLRAGGATYEDIVDLHPLRRLT